MWQLLEILNVFITLTLKQVFWKTKTFLKKLEYRFLLESNTIGNATKLPCKKLILRQIEWGLQIWPFTKNKDLPLTPLFFWIHTFRKRLSFISGCFFPCEYPYKVSKICRKYLYQSLFFNKVTGEACNFIKKETWHMYFPVNFAKFLRIPFLSNTFSGCF